MVRPLPQGEGENQTFALPFPVVMNVPYPREPFRDSAGPMRVETNGQGGSVNKGNDITLLDDLRRGSRTAAAAVVQQHNRGLWRIARGILGNDSDAEEAVQDAYVRAFASLDAFRGDASLGTWLARIVIHEALRRVERRRPTIDLADVAEQLPLDHAGSATMASPVGPQHAAAHAETSAFWSAPSMRCPRSSARCS
jgi:Sigma-70 region 2